MVFHFFILAFVFYQLINLLFRFVQVLFAEIFIGDTMRLTFVAWNILFLLNNFDIQFSLKQNDSFFDKLFHYIEPLYLFR